MPITRHRPAPTIQRRPLGPDGLERGLGLAAFNFTGGTLQAGWNLALLVPVTVGTNASNVATVDANGHVLSLNANGTSNVLSGPGGLAVIDSAGGGKVVLGGSDSNGHRLVNTYTGGTTVVSGILELLNSNALPTTGVLTVAGPGSVVSMVATIDGNGFANGTEEALAEPMALSALGGDGPAPVPEPSSLALLVAATIALAASFRRRRG